jgi:hypothetical protein
VRNAVPVFFLLSCFAASCGSREETPSLPQPVVDLNAAERRWHEAGPHCYQAFIGFGAGIDFGGELISVVCEGQESFVKEGVRSFPDVPLEPEWREAASVEGLFRMIRQSLDHPDGLTIEADYDRELGYPRRFMSARTDVYDADSYVFIEKMVPIDCDKCAKVRAEVEALKLEPEPD